MEPSRDIARLLEIMRRLRDPQTGCPWDVEQTFATISPYTIEEAYEVADAIERDDMIDLPDELGDLLLQVVFHARMAEEGGYFDFGDVVEAITRKMIRRHPHVFGDETVRGQKLAKGAWERIKGEEKAEKRAARVASGSGVDTEGLAPSLLDDIPRALPATSRALKIQKRMATVGFDWDQAAPILDKLEEEIAEVREAMALGEREKVRGEVGDLLFVVVNLARHLDIEPEDALETTNRKAMSRFRYIEQQLAARGKSPKDVGLDEMEALWQAAKATDPAG
ncbi:MAG: nucleoside triphosphate pyrophosphohydrolase [Pseudomonadota bacterium]